MRTTAFTLTLLLLLITLFACKQSAKIMADGKVIEDLIEIKTDAGYVQPMSNPAFTIEDWNIEGDIAKIIINYSGGCGKHEFKAYFNGKYMKSMPPKAGVFIEHLNGGDKCRMLLIDTLYVNLKTIRYNKDKEGSVIVGFNNTEKTNTYSYK